MKPLAEPAIEALNERLTLQVPPGALEARSTCTGSRTCTTGASRGSSGGGTIPVWYDEDNTCRSPRSTTSRSARRTRRPASPSCARTRTCSTRGPAPGCGRWRPSAGRTRRRSSTASTRPSSSRRPRGRSSTSGSRAWSWPGYAFLPEDIPESTSATRSATCYIHATVLDAKGQRMSKSKLATASTRSDLIDEVRGGRRALQR